jgi:hypothetical protein
MVTNRAAVSCCKHKEMLSVNKTNMIVLKYLGEGICVFGRRNTDQISKDQASLRV